MLWCANYPAQQRNPSSHRHRRTSRLMPGHVFASRLPGAKPVSGSPQTTAFHSRKRKTDFCHRMDRVDQISFSHLIRGSSVFHFAEPSCLYCSSGSCFSAEILSVLEFCPFLMLPRVASSTVQDHEAYSKKVCTLTTSNLRSIESKEWRRCSRSGSKG